MLYARDLVTGGHRDRLFTRLDEPWAPEDLWWLSVDGIYRPREDAAGAAPAPAAVRQAGLGTMTESPHQPEAMIMKG